QLSSSRSRSSTQGSSFGSSPLSQSHSITGSSVVGTAPAPVPVLPWKPKSQRIELCGLYIERILLEKLHLTIWEGAGLGPARGVRIGLEHIYLALELQE